MQKEVVLAILAKGASPGFPAERPSGFTPGGRWARRSMMTDYVNGLSRLEKAACPRGVAGSNDSKV